uniref:Uncharacterized protein n=1 Tax=Siphoviridae sp. ctMOb8 TaxID=2825460 RepID=A0A8S5PYM6_9CAUD|nr:MAG TPA: hypothetical protein [Siphoviridae sp. ctMOb8]
MYVCIYLLRYFYTFVRTLVYKYERINISIYIFTYLLTYIPIYLYM